MPEILLSFLIALGVSILLHVALIKPGMWIGLVDIPQGRKAHRGAIPLIGGLAMFLAYSLSLAAMGLLNDNLIMLLVGSGILLVVGALDDFFFVSSMMKLVIQVIVALMIIIFTGAIINNLGLTWTLHGQYTQLLAVGLTVFFLVGSMNSFNMMDGADGLAGGLALIAAGWLALAGFLSGHVKAAVALVLLSAIILGFLAFNARFAGRCQARLFMGDSGSVMLGCLLAAFAARLCGKEADGIPFLAILWIFAVPAIDAGSVIIRRIAAGGSPLRSDCRHIHLICRGRGWSIERTVSGLWLASAALGGFGVLGWWVGVPDSILLFGLGIPVFLHVRFLYYSTKDSRLLLPRGGEMRVGRNARAREV